MADENGDVKGAKLEDSNMANYGGKDMRDLRKKAAASDKSFVGAGKCYLKQITCIPLPPPTDIFFFFM